MAVTKLVLLAIVVAILPFAENAPSNNNRSTKEDELKSRLVFSDNDNDNSLNSNSRVMAVDTPPVLTQKNSLSQSEQQLRLVLASNNPPLVIGNTQTIKSTGLTQMDDERQNWGIVVKNTNLPEDESYFNRPLLLPKVINTKVIANGKTNTATRKSSESSKIVHRPTACDTAIIACCADLPKIMQCLKLRGCSNVTENAFPHLCSASYLNATINRVAAFYKGALTN